MTLVFATNNAHKIEEIRAVLPQGIQLLTLKEAGIAIDIPEPHPTLEENAREKALTIFKMTGLDCFSEDTGLEVDGLGGEPGVKTARYAGEDREPAANMNKVLSGLEDNQNRQARFRTVICLLQGGREQLFEGICEGMIAMTQKGVAGFGYDPIFIPTGSEKTFAEMSLEEKSRYSHRRRAVDKLVTFLNQTR